MEAIGYGFLLGIGMVLAALVILAVICLLGLAVLFADYLRKNRKETSSKQKSEDFR